MAISLPWPLQHAHRQMEVQRQTHQGRWPLASRWRLLTLTIRGQDSAASEPIASAYETFDDFIARREPDVFGYLWRLTGDEQLAYDLCQETFLRAWQHFEKIRHYEQPGAWLFRVATNLALNAIERRSAASGRVTPLRDDHPAVEDLSGRIAHLEVIHQTLLRLPTRERAALVLREVEGFSNSEIAHALDISANSVRMLLSRARAHFRQHYASDDLAPARTALIRAHTASCPHCRERLATYEEIGAGLRALQPPALDLERLIGDVHEAASSTASVTMQRGTAPLIPARIHHRSQRMMTGTAGLAAVLVLSLLAGWIFTTHGRPFVGDKTMNTPLLIPREDMPLRTTLIDMSSATDGWAIASKSANGDTPLIVLHYTNGRWTRVLTHMQGKINALKVLSATNGWAIGDHIYHYDGRTWQEVFAPGQNKEDQYETIAVAAPSSVWITSQNDSSQILYFDGSAWTWQNLPSPATRGLLYNQINSISMTSGHEGWAVARMSYMAPSNAPYPLSVVLHYADGVWSVDRTCQQCELTTVSAVSPSVVWIGGSRDTSTGPNTARLMPLLWQLSDGNWRDVPIPNSFGRGPLTGQVGRIQMLSTTEGWMIANVGDAVAGGAQYNPLFYLKNRQWVETSVLSVPIPTVGMALAFVSSSEFWGLGEYGISHYLHGVWKNVVA